MTGATLETQIVGGPEGVVYVPAGSPSFSDFQNVLVSEFSGGSIAVYQIDAGGNPIPNTRADFMTGLGGAEGGVVDPLTGDFLFSTFGGGDRVIVVSGFAPPCGTTASWSLYGAGWAGTLGVPSIAASAPPVLGTTLSVLVGNSLALPAFGVMIVGGTKANLPTPWSGTLLLDPLMWIPMALGPTGGSWLGSVTDDSALCGVVFVAQALQIDPGASDGVSFTQGIEFIAGL